MILLDHCLAGLVVGLASPVGGADVYAAAVIGGALPDLDVALGRPGTFGYLRYHRKHSHAVVLTPLLAAGIAVVWWAMDSEPHVLLLGFLALAGLMLHIGMDAMNAFGTSLGWPFSKGRLHADLIYEFDPAVSAVLALTAGVQSATRAGLTDCSPLVVGLGGLVVLLAYMGSRIISRRRFFSKVRQYAAGIGNLVSEASASVVPSSYWRWKGIVAGPEAHHILRQSACGLSIEVRPRVAIPDSFRTEEVRLYEDYARHLDVEVRGETLVLQNLVYSPTTYRLTADFTTGGSPAYSMSLPTIRYSDY